MHHIEKTGQKMRFCSTLAIEMHELWKARVILLMIPDHLVLTVHGVCIHGSPSICIGSDLLVLEKKYFTVTIMQKYLM